jgi:hypothetical protein
MSILIQKLLMACSEHPFVALNAYDSVNPTVKTPFHKMQSGDYTLEKEDKNKKMNQYSMAVLSSSLPSSATLLDMSPVFVKDKQRGYRNSEPAEANAHVKGTSTALQYFFFGGPGADLRLHRACDAEANGDGVVDDGVDERGSKALVFLWQGLAEDDRGGGK